MDIVLSTDKGFTLIETLLSLMIICAVGLISLSFNPSLNLEHYYFMNDYLITMAESLSEKKENSFRKGVYINSMGHVKQAKTIDFGRHKVIIHLGNGYASIK